MTRLQWLLTLLQQEHADIAMIREALIAALSRLNALEETPAGRTVSGDCLSAAFQSCIGEKRMHHTRSNDSRQSSPTRYDTEVETMAQSMAEVHMERGIEQGMEQG